MLITWHVYKKFPFKDKIKGSLSSFLKQNRKRYICIQFALLLPKDLQSNLWPFNSHSPSHFMINFSKKEIKVNVNLLLKGKGMHTFPSFTCVQPTKPGKERKEERIMFRSKIPANSKRKGNRYFPLFLDRPDFHSVAISDISLYSGLHFSPFL